MVYRFRVKQLEWVTNSTLLVTLTKSDNESKLFSFQPGQYAAISIRKGLHLSPARCFSIVSSPTHQNTLQFSMRVRGKFTHSMARIKTGDDVDVRGPFGGFILDVERDKKAVLIAGGIGITPFMSMMEFATTTNVSTRIKLIYGVMTQDDIAFYDTIKRYSELNSNLQVVYVVSDGPMDKLSQRAIAGRINEDVITSVLSDDIASSTFFVCGPPPFMEAVLGLLRNRAIPADRIVTEAFSQGHHRQTGKVVSWPQNMYVLGGAGLALGSIAVLVSDIMKTLPNTPLEDNSALNQPLVSGNKRERDLDSAISALPVNALTRVSPTASKAIKDAKKVKTRTITSNEDITVNQPQVTTTQPAPVSTPPSSSKSSQPQSETLSLGPKCTTSQSGVKTCV